MFDLNFVNGSFSCLLCFFFSSRRRHTICALVTGVQTCALPICWVEAGAGQVVGSLWNVSDKATLILMRHFIRRLKAGDAPEIAMQRAQLATIGYTDRSGNRPYEIGRAHV